MEKDDKLKLIAALAVGATGGLVLGNYICKKHDLDFSFSKHLSVLTKIVEQVEAIDNEDITSIKESVKNILNTIETNYDKPKE